MFGKFADKEICVAERENLTAHPFKFCNQERTLIVNCPKLQ